MEKESTKEISNQDLEVLSKLNLTSIFENTTDSVWAINTNYEIMFANKVFVTSFHNEFGISILPGVNLLSALPESLRESWKNKYDRALNNESFSFTERLNAENELLHFEVFMNPIIIEGKIIGALFFGRDVTQRRRDEEAIKESQLLLKASLESQKGTILFSINKNYEYLYFNSAHEDVMKYAYDQNVKVGMNVLECMTNEEDILVAKNNFDKALGGESHSNVREFGDDNIAYYESYFNPIKDSNNQIIGVTALARNISERKKAELALIERKAELKELNSTKDKLFSIIGHDLRDPFNNILGFSDILIARVNDTSFSEHEEYLKYINTTASNTLILLDNLLGWAKFQTRTLSVHLEKLMLSDVIKEVVNLTKIRAEGKNISLTFVTNEPIEVKADKNLLKTILRNLISNAIKYTEPKGAIHISAMQKEACVEVSVSDNGIGISKTQLNKLFQLNPESSTRGTANEKGSGLGLLLCQDFINELNGKLWVESIEGQGSDFIFTLPLWSYNGRAEAMRN
ncbi:sensor histidine kinase [Carboxylicivirga marina]|uniref:histidine kinase n=1 Tax=Carboxylicivirga marina TaxID=2800988 RepID=A0ABS1HP59_9BACT|nr:ATP-binding protein [Carboxylicivirga marina]MBK3519475.1 PAS domain-containing protein [Carboxylicivirga marina]